MYSTSFRVSTVRDGELVRAKVGGNEGSSGSASRAHSLGAGGGAGGGASGADGGVKDGFWLRNPFKISLCCGVKLNIVVRTTGIAQGSSVC